MTTEEQLESIVAVLSHLNTVILPEIETKIVDLQERLAEQEDEPFLTAKDLPHMRIHESDDPTYAALRVTLEHPKG